MTVTINGSTGISGVDGSAATPALQGGDTNTGIYFPAADNIGFTTGGTIRGRWTTDGLCFNTDTAAVNALDDYEEGTFTPTVVGSATAGTVTYVQRTGKYTKIGKLVCFQIYLGWNTGTGSGGLTFSGLPFLVQEYTAVTFAFPYLLTVSANNVVYSYLSPGTTEIYFEQYLAGNPSTTSAVAYDASAYIMASGSYMTSA